MVCLMDRWRASEELSEIKKKIDIVCVGKIANEIEERERHSECESKRGRARKMCVCEKEE